MKPALAKYLPWIWGISLVVVLGAGLAATAQLWMPLARSQFREWVPGSEPSPEAQVEEFAEQDAHAGHDHGHAGHSEATSVELSPNGLKNIDYRPVTIELGTYTRRISLPAMVVERPGRTQMNISAPLTGVVAKIYPVESAAVSPGSPLFEIRLTHEDLVTAQTDLVRTAEQLAVVNREYERLSGLGDGVIAGRKILEQEYEKQKLEASLQAERQSLLLHGLSEEQIESILETKQLIKTLTVYAPEHQLKSESCAEFHYYHVQTLSARVGQQVIAGELLAVIADHCELFVEGRAFEDDAVQLRETAAKEWGISASLLVGDRETDRIEGLKLLYLSDSVDPSTRTYRFYLSLPNEVLLSKTASDGQNFLDWRFKPGQRMELQVPVEKWEQEIVLPVEAIVEEGAERYVYQQNGDHFDRVPVHVKFRDRASVVVANDGSVFPGDVVAAKGAYEMHLTLKNKAGGGIDPHAGHNH